MKISVIIPYHKGEAYLKDCLDSLLEQSGQHMEVLLICDHVKKSDLNCVNEYNKALDIKIYHLTDKTGVAAARNLGLDMASGDYVYFLDSDDYLYGNTLELLAEAAADRDDDIVYGKKKPTWFQRSIFLLRKQEKEQAGSEEEEEESDAENGQLTTEDGSDGEGDETGEDSEHEDSGEDTEERNDTAHDDVDDSEAYSKAETDEEEPLHELTEEELLQQREIHRRRAYRVLVDKRKGVRNLSVLNILFKRDFIEEHKIRFPENLKYFSDVPFLLEALSKTDRFKKRFAAKYIKRKHNDPINHPSLNQIKDPNRFYEFVDTYYETVRRITNIDLRYRFDKKYISYYTKTFAPKLKRSQNDLWRTDYFTHMSNIMGSMDPELIRQLKGYKKRLIKASIEKNVKKSIRIVTLHLAYRKLKTMVRSRSTLAKALYIHWFLKRPLKENWVLFESFFGKNYSDSPKYIYEYLAKNYPGRYRFIWVINNKASKIPYRHRAIKRFGFRYYYYLARCKYCVFNSRQPEWMIKREGNVFIQTWHGTPLKKLVFDIDDISSASPKYKQQVYKQSRVWDYLIAANEFSSKTFRRCFLYEKEMLETGYPRNDILYAPNKDELTRMLRNRIGIPQNKKTILYAPTWRDDEYYGKGQYKFELKLNLQLMKEQLGQDYVILLRTHYFIADSLDVSGLEDFAFNLSKYDDISELYLISDILITDYSSVFFDYANLKRPMLFFTYDLDKYRDVLRGFYIDIEKEVPGPLLFTTEEVIEAIKSIEAIQKQYRERYEEFYQRFCEWDDGHAAEKVVESVFISNN